MDNEVLTDKKLEFSLDLDYNNFLDSIKKRLNRAQSNIALKVNSAIIEFYWQLGQDILKIQQSKKHWGNQLIERLSSDLRKANPGLSGFSKRSLEYMRLLAKIYPDHKEFTQQAAAQLPWAHLQLLIDKFKGDPKRRQWYAEQAITNGWSRSSLNMHIKANLYERQSLNDNKASNFRESLVQPQSDLAQEMLKNINAPIGVSEYQLAKSLPTDIKGDLPTIEEIESELNETTRDKSN